MPAGRLTNVLKQVGRLLDPRSVAAATDAQLLERFVQYREEAAFEGLLQRHGPLVLGVCRRHQRDTQDTEDSFQATFLVLANRAGTIRRGESVGSWLHGVALRVANRARARVGRRRTRERSLDEPLDNNHETLEQADGVDASDEVSRRELAAVLDEEVRRLPGKYREPVILCYFEGKSNSDAAQELGWPIGTVQGRLARARAFRDLVFTLGNNHLRCRVTIRGVLWYTAF